jgi:D-alanyl-D-alanine carboxypeptidase
VSAKSWCILADGQILVSKLEKSRREIASLTKIMTTYTALKLCETFKLDHCQSLIVVPENVTRICGTTASLNPDDILSINDLLYGIMLPSGNDAAFTLANFMGEEIIKRKFEKDNSSRHINPNSDYNHIPGVRAFLKHMNHNA